MVGRLGVQACLALYRAVAYGESHGDCVLTVAGDAVAAPRNLRVPFGVSIRQVLLACGLSADPVRVILGTPYRHGGGHLGSASASRIHLPAGSDGKKGAASRACIGCGRCVRRVMRACCPLKSPGGWKTCIMNVFPACCPSSATAAGVFLCLPLPDGMSPPGSWRHGNPPVLFS